MRTAWILFGEGELNTDKHVRIHHGEGGVLYDGELADAPFWLTATECYRVEHTDNTLVLHVLEPGHKDLPALLEKYAD